MVQIWGIPDQGVEWADLKNQKNKKNQKKHKKHQKKTKRTKKHMHHCFSLAWAIILWSAFDKVLGGAGRAIKAILFDTLT